MEILKTYGEYDDEEAKDELQIFLQPFRLAGITTQLVWDGKQRKNWQNIRNIISPNKRDRMKLIGMFLAIESAFDILSIPDINNNVDIYDDENDNKHNDKNDDNDRIELVSQYVMANVNMNVGKIDINQVVEDGQAIEDVVMDDILGHMQTEKD